MSYFASGVPGGLGTVAGGIHSAPQPVARRTVAETQADYSVQRWLGHRN